MGDDSWGSTSRRGLLVAAFGGLAAFVAHGLSRVTGARAGDGDAVVLGSAHTAESTTSIRMDTGGQVGWKAVTESATAVWAETIGPGTALIAVAGGSGGAITARSVSGFAVDASSENDTGVFGGSASTVGRPGVWAASSGGGPALYAHARPSGGDGVPFPDTRPAVHAKAEGDTSGAGIGNLGVWGQTDGAGEGVRGEVVTGVGVHGTAQDGTGVLADAGSNGTALLARGRVRLAQSSGRAQIAVGQRSRTVKPGVKLTVTAKVLVTLMGDPGGTTVLQRVAVSLPSNSFTVYLTANAVRDTRFAWLVLS